ncbi:hypothetical protein F5X97DRAFT_66267 [Nemania serpens]|nr:hypothetical protein F5X97DRAFT_66267 [Nemania serpens]
MFQLGSQTIFLNRLKISAKVLTPSVPYEVTVQAGDYNLRGIATSDQVYDQLRQVYINALHSTYIFPAVVAGLALLTSLAIENKNIKVISREREEGKPNAGKKPGNN